MSSSSFAIVRLDPNHHVITCNERFEKLFGYECDDIIGEHLDAIIAPEDLIQEASHITKSVSNGNLERLTSQRKRKDGSLVDVDIVGVPVSVGGKKVGVLGLYHDISDRLAANKALQESESRFKSLFQDSPISLWEEDFSAVKALLDPIGNPDEIIARLKEDRKLLLDCVEAVKILDVNQATLDLFNAQSKDRLLAGLGDILVNESLNAFRYELISLVKGENKIDVEIIQKKVTGQLIHGWLRLTLPEEYQDSWKRVYISIVDITDRKKAEDKLRYMSFHDAMTGLYNRAYFEEELKRLENSRQYPISIIACDLDKLKQINDTQGHAAGDNAIRSAALILGKGTFRKEDVVARTGGDEFMIILPGVDLSANPTILKRLQDGVKKFNSSQLNDGLYRPISISFGYAVAQKDDSLEEVVKQADHAMYIRKKEKYQTPATG